LFFGSSADNKVHALDAHTGKRLWEFATGGPIRFAPACWQDRVIVASDDGFVYCLAAHDGALRWSRRAGPRHDMVLGNGRLISRWPVRGGPTVRDDCVYFGAGIWPSEQVFVYAVDPATGQVRWCNDRTGDLLMAQPHPTATARSGVACQGYLAAGSTDVIVPTGRGVPAVFDRETGKLKYFQLGQNWHEGGADVTIIDRWLCNCGTLFELATGAAIGPIDVHVAAHPKYVVGCGRGRLTIRDRRNLITTKSTKDRKGKPIAKRVISAPVRVVKLPPAALASPRRPKGAEQPPGPLMSSTAWSRPDLDDVPASLIVAGDRVILGGTNKVLMIALESLDVVWVGDVDGVAHGLAVADDRLYVSTDRGSIYCFAPQRPEPHTADVARRADGPGSIVQQRPRASELETPPIFAAAAQEIIRRTGVTAGYCVDVACDGGRLAAALDERTRLDIYAVCHDTATARATRRYLDQRGLSGTRVTVHVLDQDLAAYPDYLADLVVSERSVTNGTSLVVRKAWQRLQRPNGGMLCIGKPGAMVVRRRGLLPGAANWTHQNADAANTLCAADTVVRAPLRMLWFRDSDQVLPNRHGRAPTALVADGRMFVQGLYELRALSIYNGRTLWQTPLDGTLLPFHGEASIGAAWTGSNFCIGGGRVYLHNGTACQVFDAATGKRRAQFMTPAHDDGEPGVWGYIATTDGILFGTLADTEYLIAPWASQWHNDHMYSQSNALFAMDAATGKIKWTYQAHDSIAHNAIAIAGGCVYLVDRAKPPNDELFNPPRVDPNTGRRPNTPGTRAGRKVGWIEGTGAGRLIALDAPTGSVKWTVDEDVFGTMLAVDRAHGLLLMSYQPAHQATRRSEIGNRMAVFDCVTGRRVWDLAADYEARPIINGDTIYAEPGAWDLLTGTRRDVHLARSYGCGIPIASRRLLLFRSATLGYCALPDVETIINYGGIRPGCWIPVIPAGGLVLLPDAASWCTCSYLNQATCALQPCPGLLQGRSLGN